MKRLLLPLLAALALPTAVNAESWEYYLRDAPRQWAVIMDLNLKVIKFVIKKDYKSACIKQKQINELIFINFEFFEEMAPTVDWLEVREVNLDAEKDVCSKI